MDRSKFALLKHLSNCVVSFNKEKLKKQCYDRAFDTRHI